MKKIIALASILVIGCVSLFANGHCDFLKEDYQEETLYFNAWQYLNYWYADMPEELKENICRDVSVSFPNPDMDYEEALANCVEFYVMLNR